MNRMQMIGQLNRILKFGRVSPWLGKAVSETIIALKKGDLKLAADLTAVKSYIAGRAGYTLEMMPDKVFAEDRDFNERVLGGDDVYSILDRMHYDLSDAVGQMPSGRTVISLISRPTKTTPGRVNIYEKGEVFGRNPVLRKIEEEKEGIHRKHFGDDRMMWGH